MGSEELHDISLCVWVQKSGMISACVYGFRRVALTERQEEKRRTNKNRNCVQVFIESKLK